MSENVDLLLSQLQDAIDGGRKLGKLRMVDPQDLQDLIESVRAALPKTIERAKEIVAQRAEILDRAREEAETMLATAEKAAADHEAETNARVNEVIHSVKQQVLEMQEAGEAELEEARNTAQRLVQEHAVTQEAEAQASGMLHQVKAQAGQIVAEAQEFSQDLRQRTEEWGLQYSSGVRSVVEQIVAEVEGLLANALTDVRSTQKRMQGTLSKAAAVPAFHEPDPPEFL